MLLMEESCICREQLPQWFVNRACQSTDAVLGLLWVEIPEVETAETAKELHDWLHPARPQLSLTMNN